ncbi:unnamed protein product [Paramecium sonneborni]|uniref:Uncharacterized protein n=1 Tax=Paramecium sonneborni TaxID=65129 RepID=A0A8S1RP08_9CILI|nr:unnamed protein product [Paramecium sonneborni]
MYKKVFKSEQRDKFLFLALTLETIVFKFKKNNFQFKTLQQLNIEILNNIW